MRYPVILEKADKHLMGLDITSKLFQQKIVMVDEPIYDDFASQLITQLMYLKSTTEKGETITLIVNGPGGHIYQALGIYDVIQSIKKKGIIVSTIGTAYACSAQSLILASGSKGYRKAYPNTTIMIHQPSGGVEGQATDIVITANEIIRLKELLTNIYIEHGAVETVKDLMERDCWLTAEKAVEIGLIDEIL